MPNISISADLYRFLAGLSVDNEGNVIENTIVNPNTLDEKIDYFSEYFTPDITVSPATVDILDKIKLDNALDYSNSADPDSLIYEIQHSPISILYPSIYRRCQALLADCYAILYACVSDDTYFDKLSSKILANDITECIYLADYFSSLITNDNGVDYFDISLEFSDLATTLGIVKLNLSTFQDEVQDKEVK